MPSIYPQKYVVIFYKIHILANLAAIGNPQWAKYINWPTVLMYTDFPLALGPSTNNILCLGSKSKSLGTFFLTNTFLAYSIIIS